MQITVAASKRAKARMRAAKAKLLGLCPCTRADGLKRPWVACPHNFEYGNMRTPPCQDGSSLAHKPKLTRLKGTSGRNGPSTRVSASDAMARPAPTLDLQPVQVKEFGYAPKLYSRPLAHP